MADQAESVLDQAIRAMDAVIADAGSRRDQAQANVEAVQQALRDAEQDVRNAEKAKKALLGEPLMDARKRKNGRPRSQGTAADLSRLVGAGTKKAVRDFIEERDDVVTQQEMVAALGVNSGGVSLACRALAAEGLITPALAPNGSKPNVKAWRWTADRTAAALVG